jgi:hypothetical protein
MHDDKLTDNTIQREQQLDLPFPAEESQPESPRPGSSTGDGQMELPFPA